MIKGSRYILDEGPPVAGGKGGAVRVFEISQQDTKTTFRLLDETANVAAELDQFERFQKSFIVHYSYYRALARSMSDPPIQAKK
jgi:hypothetical protein